MVDMVSRVSPTTANKTTASGARQHHPPANSALRARAPELNSTENIWDYSRHRGAVRAGAAGAAPLTLPRTKPSD